jgi:hypothetical protein
MRAVLVALFTLLAAVSALPTAAEKPLETSVSKFADTDWKHITPEGDKWTAQPGKVEAIGNDMVCSDLKILYANIKSIKDTALLGFPKPLKQASENIAKLLDQAALTTDPKYKDFTDIPCKDITPKTATALTKLFRQYFKTMMAVVNGKAPALIKSDFKYWDTFRPGLIAARHLIMHELKEGGIKKEFKLDKEGRMIEW